MHQISKMYFVIKLYMFQASSVPIIRSIYCTLGNWYVSCRLCDRGRGHITCMKYTNCQVYSRYSWWCTQKMPETCRVLWQNKFWLFDASSWLFCTKHFTSLYWHMHADWVSALFCMFWHSIQSLINACTSFQHSLKWELNYTFIKQFETWPVIVWVCCSFSIHSAVWL